MPTLYAILVAINDYPTYPLKGCINDKVSFQNFLVKYCENNDLLFECISLENDKATREEIISSFDHYRNADTKDICLFYFAGHGSHYPVPDSFKHLEPDGELETIVCYDIRLPGGRDLVDKELSYLIWEVGQESKQPFITIMDCCHSGAFRATSSREHDIAIREVGSPRWIVAPDKFLGYEKYRKYGRKISPPPSTKNTFGCSSRHGNC